MHIVVTTPLGKIQTISHETTDESMEQGIKLLEGINTYNYMELLTEDGSIYLPKGMIQQSIFALVK